jgi:hypothetical protein
VQKLVETQDTPLSSLNGTEAVLGLGLGTTDQVVPSHISTRVNRGEDRSGGVLPAAPPTATQKLVEIHETPKRSLPTVLGFGLGTTDQVVPSHVSTRVGNIGGVPPPSPPTAVHFVAETQDTPLRALPIPPGLGLGTTDQVVPSHVSTRVRLVEKELSSLREPTAVHMVVERQDTPLRRLANVLGLGLGSTDHVVPSTPPVSMRVWAGPPLLLYWPTAVHEPTAGHDTPRNR